MTITRETIKRLLIILIILIVAGIIIGYAYFASHGIITGPSIVISSPSQHETLFSTSTLVIQGIALRVQSLTFNGRPILIDEAGNFSETILLSPGYNVETIQGKDKFGHIDTVYLPLTYESIYNSKK